MKTFQILRDSFEIDGEKTPLLCGEIHYFRMPRDSWEAALDRLVESGCNAVAYYVPWFVHEYEEGRFDFTGEHHPDNNLREWIRLTEEKGLLALVRPGPYIYAETTDLGIPVWFSQKHPNAAVQCRKDGKYVPFSRVGGVGHQHPAFLEAVSRWYGAVAAEIREHLAPRGNIVMVQLCNEIPGDDYDDRNPENLGIGKEDGLLPSYLREKYGSVEALNRAYGADFPAFSCVEPHLLEQADPFLAGQERLSFYYTYYYPLYFQKLRQMMEDNGVHSIFLHNAYNPRAVSLHVQNRERNPWLHIGVDCYYSLSGRLGMKDATYYCEYGAEYIKQFLHDVPWIVEHECGYWNDFPTVYGPELYIWNIWAIAGGYQGFNMYLFASGVNRPGMGFFGTDHNWQAPVCADGSVRPSFAEIRRSLSDILENKKVFLAPPRYDLCLGVKRDPGLIWKDAAKPSNEAYFALKSAGFTPMLCDFEKEPLSDLLSRPALFVVCDAELDGAVQEKLLRYVQEGGTLVISGMVPYREPSGKPCTVLADGLGVSVSPSSLEAREQEKLIFGGQEYFIGTRVQEIAGGEVWAREREGRPAAVLARGGKGRALLLPFAIDNLFYATSEAVRLLLRQLGIEPLVSGARQLRILPKEGGSCVALNLHPVEVCETVRVGEKTRELRLAPHSFQIF